MIDEKDEPVDINIPCTEEWDSVICWLVKIYNFWAFQNVGFSTFCLCNSGEEKSQYAYPSSNDYVLISLKWGTLPMATHIFLGVLYRIIWVVVMVRPPFPFSAHLLPPLDPSASALLQLWSMLVQLMQLCRCSKSSSIDRAWCCDYDLPCFCVAIGRWASISFLVILVNACSFFGLFRDVQVYSYSTTSPL